MTEVANPESKSKSPSVAVQWHKPAFILFVLAWLIDCTRLVLRLELPSDAQWVESLLLCSVTITSLLGLARRLPFQNVLTAATLIAVASLGITEIGAYSGIPFGPIFYTDIMGEPVVGRVPWTLPLLWVVLIINGRGVARLIMRPWRKTNYYGYWVIGFTCAVVVLFDLCFEPFAVHVKGYWFWLNAKSALTWYTAPLANFLGWFIGSLGMVVFAIPWLINKQPIKQPTDYHPLIIWSLLSVWILIGNVREELWAAVVVTLLVNGMATVYAVRGGRW
jgi:uncharacterized membrane protein